MTFLNSRFPIGSRIRTSSDFKKVFDKGGRLYGEHYTIVSVPNSFGFSRLGLVVGKKRIPGAVKRNRVKRVLREVFRNNNPIFDSLDVLIIPKKGSESVGYKEAEKEIARIIGSGLT